MKKIIYISFLVIFLNYSFHNLSTFNNLSEITNYAQKKEEYPKPDKQDFLNTDYSSFYKQETPGFLGRFINKILDFIYIKKELWSANQLNKLLQKVTKQREEKNYKDEFILKITPQSKTEFVLWGDIQGAFHSLARDLEKLEQDGFIDDKLKIIKPNCYFIFEGNLIGRSAYIIETLTIVLSLMKKNPDKIIYIKGKQETKENWKNFGLPKELKFKVNHLSSEKIPLQTQINAFLNTLPLALYIKPFPDSSDFIRISYFNRDYEALDDSDFAQFLKKTTSKPLEMFNLSNKTPSTEQITI